MKIINHKLFWIIHLCELSPIDWKELKWPWVRQILRKTLKRKLRRYQGKFTTPSALQYKNINHDLIMINRKGILVTHYHGYTMFVVISIRHFPHSWLSLIFDKNNATDVISRTWTLFVFSLALCPFWLASLLFCLYFDLWLRITLLVSSRRFRRYQMCKQNSQIEQG